MATWRSSRGGFTLIELLVVILIIGILTSILLPSLAGVRETARRLKCLTNLKGFGVAFELYRKDHKDLLPRVLPFHEPDLPTNPNDPQLFDTLRAYMDVEPPRRSEEGNPDSPMITYAPYLCPSDRAPDGPGATTGFSYEYWAGVLMIAREVFGADRNAQFTATKFYEQNGDFAVLADANDMHVGNQGRTKLMKNALYFGDWRADWMISDPRERVPSAPPVPPNPPVPPQRVPSP